MLSEVNAQMLAKEMLANPDPNVAHCHGATITLTPAGDLLVAWYAYPEDETREATLAFTRKPAGSSRFERPVRILANMSNSLGNPVLFCDAEGRVHLLFVSLRGHYWDSAVVCASFSEDVGTTWSTPEVLRLPAGTMVRYPPVMRRNSYMLLPAYDESANQTALLTAGPDGRGWFPVTHFDDLDSIQGSIARQNDDELVMMLRPCGDRRTCLRTISGDDGRSWSRVLPTPLPCPLSGVAAFQMGPALCAVYNHTTEHRRYPLSLSYSTDRGTSWTGPFHIDETPHEVSYPSFVVDQAGVAHGVYTFGRSRIQYVSFDQNWWAT